MHASTVRLSPHQIPSNPFPLLLARPRCPGAAKRACSGSLGCPGNTIIPRICFCTTWLVGVAKKPGTAPSAGSKKMAKKIRYPYRPTR